MHTTVYGILIQIHCLFTASLLLQVFGISVRQVSLQGTGPVHLASFMPAVVKVADIVYSFLASPKCCPRNGLVIRVPMLILDRDCCT
jgi:hypothetical protein